MKIRFKLSIGLLGICAALALTSCGSKGGAPSVTSPQPDEVKQVSNEPFTLKIVRGWLSDDDFQHAIVEPMKKKHPNVTIEKLVVSPNKEIDLQNMLSGGAYPDIILTSSNLLDVPIKMGFTRDIQSILKQHNVDFARFEDGSIDSLKQNAEGKLIGLPYLINFSALYYNKDIFDKFGVPYPKDGMTWDDAIELAKKVSRTEGGMVYSGLHPDAVWRMGSQLGLGVVDPKTNKPIIESDGWNRVLQTYKNIFKIPGNQFILGAGVMNGFYKDRTRAMYASNNQLGKFKDLPDFNWDMTTYPTFRQAPGIGMKYDMHLAMITPQSEHPDTALEILSSLTSNETQMQFSRTGTAPILKEASIKEAFGQDLPYLKGKNIQAAFKTKPATPAPSSKWDSVINNYLAVKSMKNLIEKGQDINTVLRDAEEHANQLIQSDK